jgi:hypothetical protein
MSGSIWNPGGTLINSVESNTTEESLIASAGQTTFTLTTIAYEVGAGALVIYRNGQRLRIGDDFTEVSSTSFNLLVSPAVAAGEIITAVTGLTTAYAAAAAISATNAATSATASASSATDAANSATAASNAPVAVPTHAAASKATPADADEFPLVDSAASFVLKKWTWANLKAALTIDNSINDFRLSLQTGVPVPTADQTSVNGVYLIPYKGNRIALYNGTVWNIRIAAQQFTSLGTLVASRPYDVFCYDNAGTPTLEYLAWTNDTTRATALTYQDGVLVKSGDATRRYLGSFYTTSTTTTEDSVANRYLWNYYNRVVRPMKRVEATASWTYATAAWRQANGSVANQLNFIVGMAEDVVCADVLGSFSGPSTTTTAYVGIGLNATNANSGVSAAGASNTTYMGGVPLSSAFKGHPAVGRNYLAWIEYAGGSTCTFYGSTSSTGIIGDVIA